MKTILIVCLAVFCTSANAQFGKRLKEKAKEATERKANQKVDEAINKGVDKIDSVISGKKRETKSDKTAPETETTESKNENSSSGNEGNGTIENNYKEVVVKTNIRCETGKKKLESILRNADGVISAMIDSDNGNLYLSSENPDVRNKVIDLIRQNGFEADGMKPTKSIPDPCK
ncbi:MAG: hypothetical protein ABIP79_17420 [Chitinophagaceae bacterium]